MKYSYYASNNPKRVVFSFRWQLLTLSLTPLLLAIVITTLILLHNIDSNNKKRKKDFFNNIKEKVTYIIAHYVQEIEALSEINNITISREDISYKNTSRLQTFFLRQIQFNIYLNNVFFADEEGGYVSARLAVAEDGTNIFVRYRNKDTKGKIWEDKFNKQGKRVGQRTIIENASEPRNRPWYKQGKQKGQAEWSPPYQFQSNTDTQSERAIGITYIQPIKNSRTNQFQGVIGLDLPFQLIEEYLKDIDTTKKKAKFLIFDCSSQNNSSKLSRMIVQSNIEQKVSDKKLLETIKKNVETYPECQSGKEKNTPFKPEGYDVKIFPLTIENLDFNWLLVIAIPDQYFIQGSKEAVLSVLRFSGLLIILTLPLSLFLARRISQPITIMTDAAHALESENFDSFDANSLEKIGNRKNELGILAKVFLDMTKKVYDREQSMREKLQELEETTSQQQKTSLLMEMTEREYLLQLIKKSQKNRQ